MLHIVAWAALYSLILVLIGWVTRSWRDRTCFKLIFLPGTAVGALIKRIASLISLGSAGTIQFVQDREPYFKPGASRVSFLTGGLFLILTHGMLYVLFAVVMNLLDARGVLAAYEVSLPNLYPYDIAEGYIEIAVAPYFQDLGAWTDGLMERPLLLAMVVYADLSIFASMGITGLEWRRGGILLFACGSLVYAASWYGVGVGFLTRGWWASIFHVPTWWAMFSLFITFATLALCSLVAIWLLHDIGRRAWQRLTAPDPQTQTQTRRRRKRRAVPAGKR
jgi:hypothetical protein